MEDKDTYRRVGGTSIGVSLFVGIMRYMALCSDDPTDMCEAALKGDSSKIDMSVGDIYGGQAYDSIGLGSMMIASSFGKLKDVPHD